MRRWPDHSGEAGSALVFVLWISALLAVILAGVMAQTQAELRLTAGRRAIMVNQQALQSALDLVAFDTALSGRSYLASLPRTVAVDGLTVRVSLAPSQRQLDINMATSEQWIALFTRLGEPETTARRLADQILDWRDSDAQRRPLGAEEGDYPPGTTRLPQNRPFMSVAELIDVRDMTARRLACATPYLTVFGGTPAGELDASLLNIGQTMDGVRVAFRAELVAANGARAQTEALALFGNDRRRPFEWVAFLVPEIPVAGCTDEVVGGQSI
tara:strand:+ start:63362 stop:64174 length:813 start_codon:yes stop_codon:yes gene_type:complete